jgi:hypothetical protein
MLGGFLLTFLGYGAWGLAGIFISVFLVKGLERIIEDMFKIEEYSLKLRELYRTQNEVKAGFAEAALEVIRGIGRLRGTAQETMTSACYQLNQLRYSPLWVALPPEDRATIDQLITQICAAAAKADADEYRRNLEALKELMEGWRKLA